MLSFLYFKRLMFLPKKLNKKTNIKKQKQLTFVR